MRQDKQYITEHPIVDGNGFAAVVMLFAGIVAFAILVMAAVSPIF